MHNMCHSNATVFHYFNSACGRLVFTNGMAPCFFRTSTITLSFLAGWFRFTITPQVQSQFFVVKRNQVKRVDGRVRQWYIKAINLTSIQTMQRDNHCEILSAVYLIRNIVFDADRNPIQEAILVGANCIQLVETLQQNFGAAVQLFVYSQGLFNRKKKIFRFKLYLDRLQEIGL